MSRLTRTCQPGLHSGLTLVEVVASLALMGTLLVSALLGASAHLRQIRLASQKQTALESIDRFLNSWAFYQFADKSLEDAAHAANVSLTTSYEPSTLRDAPNMAIRLALQPQAMSAGFEIEVVRVEAVSQMAANEGTVLSWIEIVRPKLSKQLTVSAGSSPGSG